MVAGALAVFAYLTGNVVFADYLGIPYVPGVGEMVEAVGRRRQVAPGKLVRPLGPCFDPGQTVLDGVLDGLVVAHFEMQAVMILESAPVATVERIASGKVERASD